MIITTPNVMTILQSLRNKFDFEQDFTMLYTRLNLYIEPFQLLVVTVHI